jgi:hypothetical protein
MEAEFVVYFDQPVDQNRSHVHRNVLLIAVQLAAVGLWNN